MLQIPAFLCRQTDLLVAAAETGRVVNVKKGQFLAPWDMKNVVAKVTGAGNRNVLVTERGASFGYNTLVSDMRALPILARDHRRAGDLRRHPFGAAAGRAGRLSGGEREFVPVLARAAVAVGVAGVFIETHQDPDKAPSDGPNMVPLKELKRCSNADGVRSLAKSGAGGQGHEWSFRELSRHAEHPADRQYRRPGGLCGEPSSRALDPVLPHIAADFGVSMATAAGFASALPSPTPLPSR